MKIFYTCLKILIIIADVFLFSVFLFLIAASVVTDKYDDLRIIILLMIICGAFFAAVETFLIKYYSNVVVSIEYQFDDVVLKTNTKIYVLPGKYFTEIKEDKSTARTYIKYDDGKRKQTFVFQMKYSPLKTHYLNIYEMKTHMPKALFK